MLDFKAAAALLLIALLAMLAGCSAAGLREPQETARRAVDPMYHISRVEYDAAADEWATGAIGDPRFLTLIGDRGARRNTPGGMAVYGVSENSTLYGGSISVGYNGEASDLVVRFNNDNAGSSRRQISFYTGGRDAALGYDPLYFSYQNRIVHMTVVIEYVDAGGQRRRAQSISSVWHRAKARVSGSAGITWVVDESSRSYTSRLGYVLRQIIAGRFTIASDPNAIRVTLTRSSIVTPSPAIGAVANQTYTVGTAIPSLDVSVTNGSGAILSAAITLNGRTVSRIPGLTITPASTSSFTGWRIRGTPRATGVYSVALTADNGITAAVSRTFSVTVNAAAVTHAAPVIASAPSRSVTQGQRIRPFQISVTSTERATITVSGLPPNLRFRQSSVFNRGTITGLASYRATPRGYTYTVSVTTPTHSTPVTASGVITVVEDPAPVVNAPTPSPHGSNASIRLDFYYENAVGAPGNLVLGMPSWASADTSVSGRVRFTGTTPDYYGGAHAFSFSVRATGTGGRTATGQASLTVNGQTVGPAPRFGSQSTVRVNSGEAISPRITHLYYNGTLRSGYPRLTGGGSLPSWINADTSVAGQVRYTGTAPAVTEITTIWIRLIIDGTPGASINPGGTPRSAETDFNIDIYPPPENRPPEITAPDREFTRNRAITSFLISARDPDGDAVTAISVTGLPAGLQQHTLAHTIRVSGTPTAAAGDYVYTVSATAGGRTSTATGTITIVPGQILAPEVGAQGDVSLDAGDDLADEVSPLSYANGSAEVTLDPADGWASYSIGAAAITFSGIAPRLTAAETTSVAVIITAPDGRQATRSFDINVNAYSAPPPINRPPVIAPVSSPINLSQGQSGYRRVFRISDPDGDDIASFTLTGSLPSGLRASTSADRESITVSGDVSASARLGSYDMGLSGSDDRGGAARVVRFAFQVAAAGNNPPRVNLQQVYPLGSGATTIDITVTDPDAGDTLSIDLLSATSDTPLTASTAAALLPSGITFSKSGTTLRFRGTLSSTASPGSYPFRVRFGDGHVTLTESFSLRAPSAADRPVIGDAEDQFRRGVDIGNALDFQSGPGGRFKWYEFRVMNEPMGEDWDIDADTVSALTDAGLSVIALKGRYQAIEVGHSSGQLPAIVGSDLNLTINMTATDAAGNTSLPKRFTVRIRFDPAARITTAPDVDWSALPSTVRVGETLPAVNFTLRNQSVFWGSGGLGNPTLRYSTPLFSHNPFTEGWATLASHLTPLAHEVTFRETPQSALGRHTAVLTARNPGRGGRESHPYVWHLRVLEGPNQPPEVEVIQDLQVVRGTTRTLGINITNLPDNERLGTITFSSPVTWITGQLRGNTPFVADGVGNFTYNVTVAPPSGTTPGTNYRCSLTAADAAGNTSSLRTFLVQVIDVNPPPRILAPDTVVVELGQRFGMNIRVVNEPEEERVDVAALDASAAAFRAQTGLAVTVSDDIINIAGTVTTSTAALSQRITLTVQADDGTTRVEHTIRFRIKSRPVIAPIEDKVYRQGEAIAPFVIVISDPDGDPVRTDLLTITNLPSNLSLSGQTVQGVVDGNARATVYLCRVDYFDGFLAAAPVYFNISIVAVEPELPTPSYELFGRLLINADFDGRYDITEDFSDYLISAEYSAGIRAPGNFFEIGQDASAVFTVDNREGIFTRAMIAASAQFNAAWRDPVFTDDLGNDLITNVRFRGLVYDVQEDTRLGLSTARIFVYGVLRNMEATHGLVALSEGREPFATVSDTIRHILSDEDRTDLLAPLHMPPADIAPSRLRINIQALIQGGDFGTPQRGVRLYGLLKQLAQYDFGRLFTGLDGGIRFQGFAYRLQPANREVDYPGSGSLGRPAQSTFTLTEDGLDGNVMVSEPIETTVSRIVNLIDADVNRRLSFIPGNLIEDFNQGRQWDFYGPAVFPGTALIGNAGPITLADTLSFDKVITTGTGRYYLRQWFLPPTIPTADAEFSGHNRIGYYVPRANLLRGNDGLSGVYTLAEDTAQQITIRLTVTREPHDDGNGYAEWPAFAAYTDKINCVYDLISGQQTLVRVNQSSVDRYGLHPEKVRAAVFTGVGQGQRGSTDLAELGRYLDSLLSITSEPRNVYKVVIDGAASPENKKLTLLIQPGDPVHAYLPSVGIGSEAETELLWVERVQGKVEGAATHRVTLTLTPDRPPLPDAPREPF